MTTKIQGEKSFLRSSPVIFSTDTESNVSLTTTTGLNLIVRIKVWLITSFQPHYQPKIGKQALTFHFKFLQGVLLQKCRLETLQACNGRNTCFSRLQLTLAPPSKYLFLHPKYLFFFRLQLALAPASEQLQQVRLVYTMCTEPVRTERLKTKQVSFISHHVFTSYIYIKNISLKPLGH